MLTVLRVVIEHEFVDIFCSYRGNILPASKYVMQAKLVANRAKLYLTDISQYLHTLADAEL